MAEGKGLAPNERKIVIDTPRLEIRTYRPEDKEFILSTWGDRENGKYMCDPARENMDEKYLGLIDKMPDTPDGFYFVAWLKENGKPVGTCCAFPENGNYDIGYCIVKEHWREGIGTEMISALLQWIRSEGGTSASGEIADANEASVALARKLGFVQDRKTRYKKWGEETYFDAHFYRVDLAPEGE